MFRTARIGPLCLAIVVLGFLVHSNGLDGAFVFDDIEAIVENASIRSFASAFDPPPNTTVSGRPVLNASFALNHAMGGLAVRGYHLVNVTIHCGTAVAIFGLVAATLRLLPLRRNAYGIAFAAATIWVVHPLTTEVAAYIVQRGEGLAALFTVLTILGVQQNAVWGARAERWRTDAMSRGSLKCLDRARAAGERASFAAVLAATACLLGALCKETAAVAPILALLYDRAFLAGSFRESIRRRRLLYGILFASWIPATWLAIANDGRSGTVGTLNAMDAFRSASEQSEWIIHYVRLVFLPRPLVFDYGPRPPHGASLPWLALVIMLGLGTAAVLLYRSRPHVGFLPVAFFVLLAPSSSLMPIHTQIAAEHRMYLPSAIVVLAAVLAACRVPRSLRMTLWIVVVLTLAALTIERNRDYATAETLWRDTVAKRPDNARARTNLGRELMAMDRIAEATDHLQHAVNLDPGDARPWNLLGFARMKQARTAEAVACFHEVLRLDPDSADARANLARALTANRQFGEAAEYYRGAIQRKPDDAVLRMELSQVLRAASPP